jgi:NAD(P)-dependent dehydrogenase (short-subunit alcohol dehydrogenase family)
MSERSLAPGAALVTGGTSGIGRALCVALAAQGLTVVLTGRDLARAEETRQSLPHPERHHAVIGDLGDAEFVTALAAKTQQLAQGALSVLAHAAGVHGAQPLEQISAADFDVTLATNLRAPMLLSTALLPALRRARGQVVFINSSAVNNPQPDVATYAASKAGLKAFADALRALVNPDGVRVLSVFPGRTATPMQRANYEREGRRFQPELLLQPEDVAASVLAALVLPETAELTELQLRPCIKS